MSRQDRVLDDLREALRHVRSVLDKLSRSDASNTAEIRSLLRMVTRLEQMVTDVETRLNRRIDDVSAIHADQVRAIVDDMKELSAGMTANKEAVWLDAGGKASLLRLIAVMGTLTGIVLGLLKVVGMV